MWLKKLPELFNRAFGFTRTERRVVIFLVVSFLAGAVLKMYRSSVHPAQVFDYASADSEFAARSRAAKEADSLSANEDAEPKTGTPEEPKKVAAGSSKVDLNKASKEELMRLPGVGEATAARILQYRTEHGLFHSVKDLANIEGIGKKKLERMLPHCTIGK